jgi:hypothetical protein
MYVGLFIAVGVGPTERVDEVNVPLWVTPHDVLAGIGLTSLEHVGKVHIGGRRCSRDTR